MELKVLLVSITGVTDSSLELIPGSLLAYIGIVNFSATVVAELNDAQSRVKHGAKKRNPERGNASRARDAGRLY